MPYAPGQIILDKYRIETLVGRGAFAEVYHATHLSLNAPRALKVLRRDAPGLGSTEYSDFRQRFQLEAQLGAQLDHPNVIRVYDFEQDGDTLILVMEYAERGSLAEVLARTRQAKRTIPVNDALRLALSIAEGLAALHALDAVHRDLKPSNLLFDKSGVLKVADFGLAQTPDGLSARSLESAPKSHPGTPGYKSPEQQTSGAPLPPASDIYALGLILFEILTGRVYGQQEPGTLPGALLPDLPAQVDHLLTRMLAADPRERFWNGAQAAQTLRHTLEQLRHYTPASTAAGAQPLPAAPVSGRFAHAFAEARAPMTFRAPVKLRSGETVENGWDLLQAMRDNPAEAETQLYSGNFALALRESLHSEVLAALAALQQRNADRARVTQQFMERLLPALLEEGQAQTANALSARDWPRAEFLTRKLLALEPELAMAQHFRQQALRGAVQDAQTAWQAGEVAQALTYARQALTIAPEDESAAYLADMAGRIVAIEEAVAGHLQAGTPREAWALLDEAEALNSTCKELAGKRQTARKLWLRLYWVIKIHTIIVSILPDIVLKNLPKSKFLPYVLGFLSDFDDHFDRTMSYWSIVMFFPIAALIISLTEMLKTWITGNEGNIEEFLIAFSYIWVVVILCPVWWWLLSFCLELGAFIVRDERRFRKNFLKKPPQPPAL